MKIYEKYLIKKLFLSCSIVFGLVLFVDFIIAYIRIKEIAEELLLNSLDIIVMSISLLPLMIFQTIPYCFFFGCYIGVNALIANNELIAMKSLGLNANLLLRPVSYIGIVVGIFGIFLTILFPYYTKKFYNMQNSIPYDAIVRQLEPNVVNSIGSYDILFESIDKKDNIKNVIVFYNDDNNMKFFEIESGKFLKLNSNLILRSNNNNNISINKDNKISFMMHSDIMHQKITFDDYSSRDYRENTRYFSNLELFKEMLQQKIRFDVISETTDRLNIIFLIAVYTLVILLVLQKTILRNMEIAYDMLAIGIVIYTAFLKISLMTTTLILRYNIAVSYLVFLVIPIIPIIYFTRRR